MKTDSHRLRVILAGCIMCLAGSVVGDQQSPHPANYDQRAKLPINLDFYELSAATGGDFYFWAPGEFASAGLQVPVTQDNILLSYGKLDNSTRTFSFKVDSGIEKLILFVGIQRKDHVRLLRPDGQEVLHSDTDVELQLFQHMLLATVTRPSAGDWRVPVSGEGYYAFSARLYTSRDNPWRVSLLGYDFVELRGRLGHLGYFPLKTKPGAGQRHRCRITYTGAVRSASFAFVDRAGNVLNTLTAVPDADNSADDEYLGDCTVPARPYRLQMQGVNERGQVVQRITSGLIAP